MHILPLTLEDCRDAASLHQEAFFKGWTEKDFQAFLLDPLTHGLKIEEGKKICAYMLWREMGPEAEILTLVVDPSHQQKGIGSLLLKALFNLLINKGITELFLEVAEDNHQAQSFYVKHGFVLLSKRPHYYARPENTFIPALNFFKKLV
jgi:ribosomal-protein-alanine N-acetyltransferase